MADAPTSATADYAPTADTWDHVVRAVAHTRHAGAAAALMRATRAHAHDTELLWLTRAVRGGEWGSTLLACAVGRLDAARVGGILAAHAREPRRAAQLLLAWATATTRLRCIGRAMSAKSSTRRPRWRWWSCCWARERTRWRAPATATLAPSSTSSETIGARRDRAYVTVHAFKVHNAMERAPKLIQVIKRCGHPWPSCTGSLHCTCSAM